MRFTLPKRFNIATWTAEWSFRRAVVAAMKVFVWWFLVGATMALAVIMVQGGMREVMQAQGSVWELKLMELVTTIVGGGLLGGCVALILDRIKKS
jgi:hypothetical protein